MFALLKLLPSNSASEKVAARRSDPSKSTHCALVHCFEVPSTLALWRGFAWTREGSPKKGFELSATSILEAEATIATRLRSGEG
jgi:hypothetical protein